MTFIANSASTVGAVLLKVTLPTTTTVYIYRRDSRGVQVVRATATGLTVAGGMLSNVYDYEARQGDRATYFLADTAGTTLDTASETPASWGSWLKSPGRPALNIPVPVYDPGDEKLEAVRDVSYPEGSSVPVVLSAPRRASTGAVVLAIRTPEQLAAVRALLADGGTLYIDTPLEWGSPWDYVQVGTVTIGRVWGAGVGLDKAWRYVTLGDLIDVASPLVPLTVNATATYDALPVKFASYGAMAATTTTYAKLAVR